MFPLQGGPFLMLLLPGRNRSAPLFLTHVWIEVCWYNFTCIFLCSCVRINWIEGDSPVKWRTWISPPGTRTSRNWPVKCFLSGSRSRRRGRLVKSIHTMLSQRVQLISIRIINPVKSTLCVSGCKKKKCVLNCQQTSCCYSGWPQGALGCFKLFPPTQTVWCNVNVRNRPDELLSSWDNCPVRS